MLTSSPKQIVLPWVTLEYVLLWATGWAYPRFDYPHRTCLVIVWWNDPQRRVSGSPASVAREPITVTFFAEGTLTSQPTQAVCTIVTHGARVPVAP